MEDVFQPHKMLGPEGVQAEIKKTLEFQYGQTLAVMINDNTDYFISDTSKCFVNQSINQ